MKPNNKGFSLVEMIVAIAILSVVGLAVVSFLSTSTKSYASVSGNAEVQEEAQTAINQIVTLLQNAEMGITGTDKSDDGSLLIYNEEYRYVIAQSGDKLYYLKQDRQESGDSYVFDTVDVSAAETSGFSLLAEKVQSFSAEDVTTSGASRSVILLSMEFQTGSAADYAVSQNVVLRNTVTLNPTDYTDIYGTPSSPVQKTTYSNLTVTIDNPIGTDTEFSYTPSSTGAVYVPERGAATTELLSYSVKVNYTGPNPDPSYTVTLTGADDSTKTYVKPDEQQIYIDAGQTSDLELNVSLVKKPSVQVNIPIRIVRATAVSIQEGSEVEDGFGELCYSGNTVALGRENGLTAIATGTNLDKSDWNTVTWMVELLDAAGNPAAGYPQEVSGGYFTIPEGCDGYSVRFTAVSTFDSTVRAVSEAYAVLSAHSRISLAVVQESMNRGQTGSFGLTDETGASYGDRSDNLEFTVILKNQTTGEEISDTSGISISKEASTITVSADNAKLDYNQAYAVTLMAKDTGRDIESNWVTFTIPAVTVKFSPSVVSLFSSENWKPDNSYYKTVEYEVVSGIELGSVSQAEVGLSGLTSTNGLYVDDSATSYDKSTGKGKFSFYRNYTTDNLNRTANVAVNGTAVLAETLNIYGTNIPTHTLRLALDRTEVDRGGSVTVHVYSKDLTTGEETEVTNLSALSWSYYLDDNLKSGTLRSGNVITIWDNNQTISYNSAHTVKITVKDDTETASATVTVPKVTVEYAENAFYLCDPENKTGVGTYPYQKTVTYTIKGIKNAKLAKFGISSPSVSFSFDDSSFTVKCRSEEAFTLTGNPFIQVNGNGNAVELNGSTFTVYGRLINTVTIGDTTYTIEPKSTPSWMYTGTIAYQVSDGWWQTTCRVYSYPNRTYYNYRYDSTSQCWIFTSNSDY